MIRRALELTKMMGYSSMDETMEAVGEGELILVKVPSASRVSFSKWLHEQAGSVDDSDLAAVILDIASGIDMAAELQRYPDDSDVCDMDLPSGWPSYCDKDLLE